MFDELITVFSDMVSIFTKHGRPRKHVGAKAPKNNSRGASIADLIQKTAQL